MEKGSRGESQKASMVISRTMAISQKAKVAIVKKFATNAESQAILPGIVGGQFEMCRVNFNKLNHSSNSMLLSLQLQLLVVPLQILVLMEVANSLCQRPSFVLLVLLNLQMFTMLQMFNHMVK